MFQLLKTEWLKLKGYWAFWIVMCATALSYPGINYMFNNIYQENVNRKDATGQLINALLGNPFTLPEVYHTSAFASSIFVFIPAIVVIMLITNEYTYKTTRQNIIDGWSRNQFMTGKLLDVLLITIVVTVLYAIVATVIGLYNTPNDPKIHRWSKLYYVGLFAIQTFAQLSFAFLVGLLVRKALFALGIFAFYFVVVENIANGLIWHYSKEGSIWKESGRFLPLEMSDRIIPPPAFMKNVNPQNYQKSLDQVNEQLVLTLIFIVLLWLLNFWIFKKRDL